MNLTLIEEEKPECIGYLLEKLGSKVENCIYKLEEEDLGYDDLAEIVGEIRSIQQELLDRGIEK